MLATLKTRRSGARMMAPGSLHDRLGRVLTGHQVRQHLDSISTQVHSLGFFMVVGTAILHTNYLQNIFLPIIFPIIADNIADNIFDIHIHEKKFMTTH
jgi:hypothetical protein